MRKKVGEDGRQRKVIVTVLAHLQIQLVSVKFN